MNIPLKKLLDLLAPGRDPELRRSSLLVLAEVGGKDKTLAEAVLPLLDDEDTSVRYTAIITAGKLEIASAMPALLEKIKAGGEEAELSADAVAHLGAKGTKALKELMPKVAPGLRRYIASALGQGGTSSSETAAVEVLLDSDPGVVEAATRSLVSQVSSLSKSHRQKMAQQLLDLLTDKKRTHSSSSDAAMVRLLVAFEDPRVEKILWDRISPKHAATVRATALQSLGKWLGTPKKDQLADLLTCAQDTNFGVAAPALVLLRQVEPTDKTLDAWLTLLDAPDSAVRLLGLEKVGSRDKANVRAALLRQLDHNDKKLRNEAITLLTKSKKGLLELIDTILEAESVDSTWYLARAVVDSLGDAGKDWRERVFTQASAYQEAHDRRADPLWFLLRKTDEPDLRDKLEKKALALRKKKKYEEAIAYLRLLVGDPSAGFPIRVELACCGLKTSAHDLAQEMRSKDPCLMQLTRLCQSHSEELYDYIEKAKWLDNDELYYAGFHLAEQNSPMKQFGGKLLTLVAKRTPRSKLGQAAKRKLKSEALD